MGATWKRDAVTQEGPPGGRLAFERGIRRSRLPPPSRHLALTLATWADIGTGIIPTRYQPAKETLEEATGLSRGAIVKHLNFLESEGWIKRETGGGRNRRTQFTLCLPAHPETGHDVTGNEPGNGSPGDPYPEETGHHMPETGHVVNENGSPGDPKSPPSPGQSPPPAEPSAETDPDQGGGGGDPQHSNDRATAFAASLNYGTQRPSRAQQQRLAGLIAAAFAAGWAETDLREQLDPGSGPVRSRIAIYLHRLAAEQLPEPPIAPTSPPRRPTGELCACCGTTAPVAGRFRNRPYCTNCTSSCNTCHTPSPADQLHEGTCHTCHTTRSNAA